MSANVLKILALITMTIDHAGFMLFPEQKWMRIIGRIAFPIFAFMIAEGCRYTHNRRKYLLQIALMGVAMQLVMFIATKSLYQSVFISFTLAIMLIYVIDMAKEKKLIRYWVLVAVAAFAVAFACRGLQMLLPNTDYDIDYNLIGILLPVVCYFAEDKRRRMLVLTFGLVALSFFYGSIQWFCLLALPFIGIYNNQKGRCQIKQLFYIYYPAHLAVLFLIDRIL